MYRIKECVDEFEYKFKDSETGKIKKFKITEKSFTKELNYLHLNRDASRLIAQELEKKLQQTIMHKDLHRKVSYQYLIRLEAYKLIKHLIEEKEYEGFKMWW